MPLQTIRRRDCRIPALADGAKADGITKAGKLLVDKKDELLRESPPIHSRHYFPSIIKLSRSRNKNITTCNRFIIIARSGCRFCTIDGLGYVDIFGKASAILRATILILEATILILRAYIFFVPKYSIYLVL